MHRQSAFETLPLDYDRINCVASDIADAVCEIPEMADDTAYEFFNQLNDFRQVFNTIFATYSDDTLAISKSVEYLNKLRLNHEVDIYVCNWLNAYLRNLDYELGTDIWKNRYSECPVSDPKECV